MQLNKLTDDEMGKVVGGTGTYDGHNVTCCGSFLFQRWDAAKGLAFYRCDSCGNAYIIEGGELLPYDENKNNSCILR